MVAARQAAEEGSGALLPADPGSPGRPPPWIPTLGPLVLSQLQLAPISAGGSKDQWRLWG